MTTGEFARYSSSIILSPAVIVEDILMLAVKLPSWAVYEPICWGCEGDCVVNGDLNWGFLDRLEGVGLLGREVGAEERSSYQYYIHFQ